MSLQINFNGQTYTSLEEMPPEVRAAYQQAMAMMADSNANGLPDFVDSLLQGQSPETVLKPLTVLSSAMTQVVYNGQTYSSVADMPDEARAAYQEAMRAFGQGRTGGPEGLVNLSVTGGLGAAPARAPAPVPMPYTPAGVDAGHSTGADGRLRTIAIASFIAGAACLVAGALLIAFVAGPSLFGSH